MLHIALRNILRSKTRSLLTLIGIAGSIALFVSLTAISHDLKQQLDQSLAQSNIDIIVQEKGAATPVASRIPIQLIRDLQQVPGIRSTSSITVGSVKVTGLLYLFVFGVSSSEPYMSLAEWIGAGIIEGKLFQSGKKEVVLGQLAARRLKLHIGDSLVIGGQEPYRVTGIYWLGQSILDGGVMIDLKTSQALLKREGFVNMALLETENKKYAAKLIRTLQADFPQLNIIPASSFRSQIRAITMIDSFILSVSCLSLLLSCILILNTLLMAISERTREIGILMAVGWSKWMVMCLVIYEALILGATGGVFGYLLAFPALQLMGVLPAMGPGWLPATPDAKLLALSIFLSTFIAGVSALYPALFATRVQPAKALRFE